MTVYIQMSFEDWLGVKETHHSHKPKEHSRKERKWCRSHRRWDCPYHTGKRGYRHLYEEIPRAMREAYAEWSALGHKIKPMFPHDVWVYMRGETLPEIKTMRRYMKRLVERGVIVHIGKRSGYMLAGYVQ